MKEKQAKAFDFLHSMNFTSLFSDSINYEMIYSKKRFNLNMPLTKFCKYHGSLTYPPCEGKF